MQIELAKTVAAPPADAFAIVANVVDWPQIISSIKAVEVLTPGPVRPGTRLREHRTMFGRDGPQELEVAAIDPPHRLRLWADQPDLGYELDHVIDAIYGGGCRIMLIFRSRPTTQVGRAAQPFMAPFMEITLRDELEQDLSDLAAAVSRQTYLRQRPARSKT
jgi:uncharacterized protein YndB with AHSA1/START domain